MLKNEVVHFEYDALKEEVMRQFFQRNGLNKSRSYSQEMEGKMLAVLENIKSSLDPAAVISYYHKDEIRLSGNTVTINGKSIQCRTFERIRPETVNGVYVCFISAGKLPFETLNPSEAVIADLWGTFFVDSIRSRLVHSFRKHTAISVEFGPGFFGMKVKEMHKLSSLANETLIGITINSAGVLAPAKSCGVMYFDVTEDFVQPDNACRDCLGSDKSCSLCLYYRR